MYRESSVSRNGNQTNREMLQNIAIEDPTPQNCVINWTKLLTLLFGTYGLIALLWVISNAIEHMKGDGSVLDSFVDGGGLILAFFLAYVLAFGVAWYCGYQKRDQFRREAVEKAIARQRALQALNNIE